MHRMCDKVLFENFRAEEIANLTRMACSGIASADTSS